MRNAVQYESSVARWDRRLVALLSEESMPSAATASRILVTSRRCPDLVYEVLPRGSVVLYAEGMRRVMVGTISFPRRLADRCGNRFGLALTLAAMLRVEERDVWLGRVEWNPLLPPRLRRVVLLRFLPRAISWKARLALFRFLHPLR